MVSKNVLRWGVPVAAASIAGVALAHNVPGTMRPLPHQQESTKPLTGEDLEKSISKIAFQTKVVIGAGPHRQLEMDKDGASEVSTNKFTGILSAAMGSEVTVHKPAEVTLSHLRCVEDKDTSAGMIAVKLVYKTDQGWYQEGSEPIHPAGLEFMILPVPTLPRESALDYHFDVSCDPSSANNVLEDIDLLPIAHHEYPVEN
jgi:hypothetical protein